MAVTALAEDDDASSRIMPLDDADCSKCMRSIITKRAVASSVAIVRCARTRGLQFFIDRLHEHPHPVEQIRSADAEHDRLWQSGDDEAVHGPFETQPAAD